MYIPTLTVAFYLKKNIAIETSPSRFIAVLDVDVCVASDKKEQRCSSCCGGPSVCVVTR